VPRRPAKVTQADIARAIRAAKEAGANEVAVDGEGVIRIALTASSWPRTRPSSARPGIDSDGRTSHLQRFATRWGGPSSTDDWRAPYRTRCSSGFAAPAVSALARRSLVRAPADRFLLCATPFPSHDRAAVFLGARLVQRSLPQRREQCLATRSNIETSATGF
jgi:hypothetical protein